MVFASFVQIYSMAALIVLHREGQQFV